MTLLTIVRDAAIQAGLSLPTSAASSTDQTAQELTFYASVAVDELRAWHDWSMLAVSGTITGDDVTTDWPAPVDFERMSKGQEFRRSGVTFYKLTGPLNALDRNEEIARSTVTPYRVFWFRGGKLVITPALASGDTVKFEYQSKYAVKAADNTLKENFTLDNDTCLLDEKLVALATCYLWKDAKGIDTTSIYDRYRQRAQLLAGRDAGLQPVASGRADPDLPPLMIPETIVVT